MFVVRLLFILLIPLYACAPLSETEQYEQENRLILAKEEFARRAEYCEREF